MGVRSAAKEMHERDHNSDSSSLVTSLMKSWRISSASSSKKPSLYKMNTTESTSLPSGYASSADRDRRTSDGNFEAMAKQQASTRRTSNSYSPLRYVSPTLSTASNESPRPALLLRQHHQRNHHHQQPRHSSSGSVGNNCSNSTEPNKKGDRYFKDLDEDWSAVIDDYNMPIPILTNGGFGTPVAPTRTLSRKSTSSSINSISNMGTSAVRNSSSSFTYPQLPQLQKEKTNDFKKTQLEIENERDVQELNSIIQRISKFDNILKDKTIINQQDLRQISWNGIPKIHRPVVWKLLIGYLPVNTKRQEGFLQRKRKEYRDSLKHTFSDQHSRDIPTWHQIEIDIPRTNPHIPLYQFKSVQNSLQRILYLWAIRHPASGYVQGINDLVTPFFETFLTEYLPPSQIDDVEIKDPSTYMVDEQITDLEADTFWCLTKLLEQITDNYIHGQPGILRQVKNLSQLVKRIDADLYNHFQNEHVEFIQFAFRWMNCLLMREFQMGTVIRMWDTYLSETSQEVTSSYSMSSNDIKPPVTPTEPRVASFVTPTKDFQSPTTALSNMTPNNAVEDSGKMRQSSLNEFHVFVCAAFLIKWSDQLMEMDFQETITFLQNPPTKDWTETDIEMLLSEAFIWQSLYKDATSHWL
ncbi:ALI_HP2_G0048930.mRNA.1.CDS.1 [Saccharomyces cerevisiae]|nr:ALI_HP2_G0048930.mRNA.1.CDS.1 [Saccharomyces cerevisiae]CAI6766131.1 ALI_HP2_G0048930.mRNA.1.CDS.1 [Saccharomyces cerevisiae]CAI6778694.1 ALI_HP1_G0049680.mRNA.1.CDS.1 [Saccharomyces cerevisiae]